MLNKIKQVGIIIGCILALVVIVGLLIITGGKNQKIKKLLATLTDTWKKNVIVKESENAELNVAFDKLSEQEKQIIKAIEEEPNLKLPDRIDPTDYKAMIKWFNELERHYD